MCEFKILYIPLRTGKDDLFSLLVENNTVASASLEKCTVYGSIYRNNVEVNSAESLHANGELDIRDGRISGILDSGPAFIHINLYFPRFRLPGVL